MESTFRELSIVMNHEVKKDIFCLPVLRGCQRMRRKTESEGSTAIQRSFEDMLSGK